MASSHKPAAVSSCATKALSAALAVTEGSWLGAYLNSNSQEPSHRGQQLWKSHIPADQLPLRVNGAAKSLKLLCSAVFACGARSRLGTACVLSIDCVNHSPKRADA